MRLLLAVQILLGLVASAAVSTPRDASPEIQFTPVEHIDQTPNLSKRLTYNPNAAPGENHYCGELAEWPTPTADSSAPLTTDCLAIRTKYAEPVRGYWTISTADQASAPGGWITLATHGTCAFKVLLEPGQAAKNFRVGSDDVWFYTGYARGYEGGGKGRYKAVSNVQCNWSGSTSIIRWQIGKV